MGGSIYPACRIHCIPSMSTAPTQSQAGKKKSAGTDPKFIRNFSIVAHIDHGKSTLADRLLEVTGTVDKRQMKEQLLDDMELERQRGITIKANSVSMRTVFNGQEYELNLIDTPGHVDFQYEVSRSLTCCEGALLLVDAFQGVEAQTVANAYNAIEHNLEIVPVLNKIDLTHARPEEVKEEIEHTLGLDAESAIGCSAKTGLNCDAVIEAVINRIPPPAGDRSAPLQAMVFDSVYDEFRGAIIFVRIVNGVGAQGRPHQVPAGGHGARCDRARPKDSAAHIARIALSRAGGLSDLQHKIARQRSHRRHGDDRSWRTGRCRCPVMKNRKRMVFCGLYPSDGQDFENLRESLSKLQVNDPSFVFEPETSDALGFGFRCGFLGLLHMEIVQQRLEQEADIDLVQTAPNVTYQITKKDGEELEVHTPTRVPDLGDIEEFRQPIVRVSFVMPTEYVGGIMKLCADRRGAFVRQEYLSPTRVMLVYDIALAEVVYDMHDKLKSTTRGYGTMDYELRGYETGDLVRMDILVKNERVDALSIVCDRRDAEVRGRAVIKKLKKEIPRHMFEVALQAAIGTRIIARETISAMRKNVTAKCYGGDISRKRKLWEKQKEGKKRMKSIGSVDIPQKAFLAVLETGEDENKK